MNIKEKFIFFVKKYNLVSSGQKILLGVSGGPDSLAMLHLFCELKEDWDIEIAVAHINHSLRKESDKEALFVEEKAKKYGIPFYIKKLKKGNLQKNSNSVEAAARKCRLEFFNEIIENNDYHILSLAHQKNDQVETVLFNFFRGTGLRGLSGISPQSRINGINIIHPLLEISRKEILLYCQKQNLNPKFDKSNEKNIYTRNVIRNQIIPIIKEKINPSVDDVICRNSALIKKEDQFLNQISDEMYIKSIKKKNKKEIVLDLDELLLNDQVIVWRIIRKAYKVLNNNLDDLYYDHVMEVYSLIKEKKTGKSLDLPFDIKVMISYNKVIFRKNLDSINPEDNKFKFKFKLLGEVRLNELQSIKAEFVDKEEVEFSRDKKICFCDFEKIKSPLYVRSRKDGDKFVPLGMEGSKKIKDFFIDEKVDKRNRDQIPIVADSEDNIVWVAGFRVSEKVRIDKNTTKVLKLKLINEGDKNAE
ncbi:MULTISPECIES: tRNA lysidine(34) synthetase TilS [unclassified Halanaerobium]|uniref:tRNA lysidine(34) synthetase TilS n=1 Tax=unclassified Halanaerobium TaxID=2641197 RepID=UPI000DF1F47D|nr:MULTISPECIES: tRNA lysidine(34) synthetase TilS [unclassified Halanaerobium]RCW41163.1 tRNA(Ile)-lysidine synthase [Halanaerobium sp. MA284_MarDTE_T2]RCW79599.1 tRNA(Ile)-lysidine synthase [Halanaerobium sp. DL-01]